MAYGRRRARIPYEETEAGMRAAQAAKRNADYREKRTAKTKGLVRLSGDPSANGGTEDHKEILAAVKALGPRNSWKRIGSETNASAGEPTENLFAVPGVGYCVDYGVGGDYYVIPRTMTRVRAKLGKFSRTWTGGSLQARKTSRTPMLKRVR
jgi:hypothetical protein